MMSKIFAAAMLAVASAQPTMTIVETVAANNATLGTLLATLLNPTYVDVLTALGTATPEAPFTVFAPLDTADWSITTTNTVAQNKDTLLYHVITAGSFPSEALAAKQFVNTASVEAALLGDKGAALGIVKEGDMVTLSNGIATFTAKVVTANILCTNGVVHTIDTVLEVPKKVSEVATAAGLSELVDAVVLANLVTLVDTTETVTIFAPNNKAMTDAGWANLTVAELTAVLAYHVIVGTVAYSPMITSGDIVGAVATYDTTNVFVSVVDGKVMINDATVVTADALVKNGVVHIIDKVLIPGFVPPVVDTGAPTTASSATASSMGFACLFSVVAAIALN